MYMLILNFTYPLRCLRVPPVEYHWARQNSFTACVVWGLHIRNFALRVLMIRLWNCAVSGSLCHVM